MKKKLHFLLSLVVLTLFASVSANAQGFEDGKYYLLNVASGKYWGAGNKWGTQASLVKNPEFVTLIGNEDGTYTLESQVSNGNGKIYFGGDFMDGDVKDALTITPSGENYTISGTNGLYGYDGKSTVLGKNLEEGSENALWNIISEAEMIASLTDATAEKPVDATFLILDANFGRNNRNVGEWIVSEDCTNKSLGGGGDENHYNACAESYHSVFTISQTIENAPKGLYKFTAQGFYRQDGTDNENLPKFFINDKETVFPLLTGKENSMGEAGNSFMNGAYAIEPMFVELSEDGEIVVGTKLEVNKALWCIWDNFELTYYGADASVEDAKLADVKRQMASLVTEATELKDKENVSPATVSALEAAIDAANELEAIEEADAVIAALNAAVAQAKKDIVNKPAIDALYALAESTNVYTADAYATYKAWVDAYQEQYEAGTLTETVVNPDDIQGWHAANSYDDLLLSAWTIGGEQANNFDKALYINTWSTEGNTDGSNFGVPFFEYWVGDGESLGANTMSATVEGVAPGDYEVYAWVRVRAKNGTAATDATGITLSVNEGEIADVTEGAQIGASQFNLAKYKAVGTVGADGKLVITFNVAAENNISWLSFKNVRYNKLPGAVALENSTFDANPENIITVATYGYQRNIPAGSDGIAGLQPVDAWVPGTQVASDPGFIGGVFAYGSTNKLNDKTTAPATNPEGGAEGVALGLAAVWDGVAQYTQEVTLPAGNYILTYSVYNAANTKAVTKNLFGFIDADGKEYLSNKGTFTVGSWDDVTVKFTLNQETTGKISVGYRGSGGSGDAPHLYVDNVSITSSSDLDLAKADVKAVLDKLPAGEGLFYYSPEAIAAAKAALEVASTIEEVEAVEIPAINAPEADKAYAIVNNTAEGNLCVATEKVTVDVKAQVYFTAVDGGFVISNAEGEYIFKTTTDGWTLSTTTNIEEAYVLTVNPIEGGYSITGSKGMLGTDNTTAGSAVYADKSIDKNGVWTIKEYVPTYSIEIAETENGTVTAVAEAEVGETVTLTVTPAEGYELDELTVTYVVEGEEGEETKAVEVTEDYTFTMPEANVTVSATFAEIVPEITFENTPLTQDMFKTWDGFDASAKVVGEHPYWDAAELGTTVGAGATIYGSGNVTNADYADISAADVLRIEGTPGVQLRVMFNRQADNSLTELNPTIGEDGYVDVDLTSYEYVHLNAIKFGWGSPEGAITSLILNPIAEEGQVFAIEIAATENGTVTADVEEAEAGATVTLTVTPAEGYELDELTVTYGEDNTAVEVVEAEDGTYTFTMPEDAVTVTATFAEVPPVIAGTTYEGFLAENGFMQTNQMDMGNKTEAQTVTVADPVDGVTSITFSGINFVGTTLPMPVNIPEFTIEGVKVTENEDGSVSYSLEEFEVAAPSGMMTINYKGTLQGVKVNDDATPVIAIVLSASVKLTAVFAATAEEAEAALAVAVGIDTVKADAVKADGKYLENGKVVIIRNGIKYGVNGAAIK